MEIGATNPTRSAKFWRDFSNQMAAATSNNRSHIIEFVYMGFSLLGSFLILRWALNKLDPNKAAKEKAKDRRKQLAKFIGKQVDLDQYEEVIAQEVINPRGLDISLTDVGGLDDIIDDLRRNIITPMRHPERFRTSLLRQKRGVLLYGPPGTGKTMLAKALAKECGASFINLKASTVLSKWYGDTNKLVRAVWSLAKKVQPAILFIDEVDSLLGSRRNTEHEATTALKTEFMQLWEGFESRADTQIVVLGATNKRDALDDAVLRRFSLQYEVKLPGTEQREAILRLLLQRHIQDMDCGSSGSGDGEIDVCSAEEFVEMRLLAEIVGCKKDGMGAVEAEDPRVKPLRDIALRTEGFSGSDLSELCSQAAAIPVHEFIAALERWMESPSGTPQPTMEPLSKHHFEQVLMHMVPPSRLAQAAQQRRRGSAGDADIDSGDIEQVAFTLIAAARRGMRANVNEHPIS